MNSIISQDLENIIVSTDKQFWQRLDGKSILVSGATGMLPSYMVFSLLELNRRKICKDIKIIALCRNKQKAEKIFKNFITDSCLEFIIQDVSDKISYDGPIDILIHAASQASPKYYGTDPVGTLSANVFGTANMLELAREKRAESFMFFSSAEVYGNIPESEQPVKESFTGEVDILDRRSCYAESKRMGENMCVSWSHQYGLRTVIVRPFHTYGPCMQLDDGRVFADFINNIISGNDIILKSSGEAKRAFCYITDAVTAYFKILLDGENAQAYNVGNPEGEISIKDLAVELCSLFPERELKVVFDIPSEQMLTTIPSRVSCSIPDISLLKSLGWKPAIGISEGFRRTIQSLTENH